MRHAVRSIGMCVALTWAALAEAQSATSTRLSYAASTDAPGALGRAVVELAALEQDGRLRETFDRPDTLLEGRRHQVLQQYHEGLRVVGGVVRRQLAGASVVSVFGSVMRGLDLPIRPTLASSEAASAAVEALGGRPRRTPELVVWTDRAGRSALAYEVMVAARGDVSRTFIDAHSGRVLASQSGRRHQAAVGSGAGVLGDRKKMSTTSRTGGFFADDRLRPPSLVTFDLNGDLARTLALLEGVDTPTLADVASDADNQWTDGAVVDAHAHLGRTYDFLFERFGRRGLDDHDRPIRAIVHPVHRFELLIDPEAPIEFFSNAFWCGACGSGAEGMMVFGEGFPPGVHYTNGQTFDFMAGALDVVAHELAHGVTEYSSQLEYEGESGALNEAFSDIVGVSAEFFAQPTGDGVMRADYTLGEDVVSPWAIRSLSDPGSLGDPDHYSTRYLGDEDYGGVHTNSTIAGHAFYLAIEGGVNRTSGRRVNGVGGLRRDRVEKVFFRAFVSFLTPRATFADARVATLHAARELYGAGSDVERAIADAWNAVGVE